MAVSRDMNRLWRVGVALAILACLAACATVPKTEAQKEADRVTAQRVESALEADRALYAKHIYVRADNGVVHLSGYVWDPADVTEAIQTAELVEGVARVVNNLELERNGLDNSPVAR